MTLAQWIKILIGAALLIGCLVCWIRLKKHRKQLMLAGLASLIGFGIAELFLRFFLPQYHGHDDLFEPDDELGWRFRKNYLQSVAFSGEAHHYVTLNEFGFRDPSFERRQDTERTILCLGDSFVSNLGVPDQSVFTQLLEKELASTSVLNLGVNGYGLPQEYLLIQQHFAPLEPVDLIIQIIYLRNDFTDNLNSNWNYPRPISQLNADGNLEILPAPNHPSVQRSWTHHLGRLHLVSLLNHGINNAVYRWQSGSDGYRPTPQTPPELYLCAKEEWEGTDHLFELMEHWLIRMQTFASEADVPILFVFAPTQFQVDDTLWQTLLTDHGEDPLQYDTHLPNNRLVQFCQENELKHLDLLPPLRAASSSEAPLYHRKEQHWNQRGNQEVAKIIAKHLREIRSQTP